MLAHSGQSKRQGSVSLESGFSDEVEALRTAWRRSTDSQFICGLPGKEYELWSNVSLRMGVMDALRVGRQGPVLALDAPLMLGRQIYKALPIAVAESFFGVGLSAADILLNAERAETEFATAGIEGSHVVVVSSNALRSPMFLFDCIIGAAATDASIAFLSDIHRAALDLRSGSMTVQTAYGMSNLGDCQIYEAAEIFGHTIKHY